MAMKQTVSVLQGRMDRLRKKDPVGNARIISKLERKIRKIESQE